MNNKKLFQKAATWEGGTWAERIDQSASMLFCHGYISMSQREVIGKKLAAQLKSVVPEKCL